MNFLNQHIYSEILKGLNGVNTDNQLFLGYYTPKILVECGMPNLPLMTNSSHLKENIFSYKEAKMRGLSVAKGKHYHGLGIEKYVEAIKYLDNPLAIYRWQKNNKNKYDSNSYIVLTQVKDKNNLKVIIPIEINKNGTYNNVEISTNKVSSVYGKGNVWKYFEKYVMDNSMNLLYKKGSVTNDLQSVTNNTSTDNSVV